MKHYPFDIQVCKNRIEPASNSKYFAKLLANEIIYGGPKDLMKYDVTFRLLDTEPVRNFLKYID